MKNANMNNGGLIIRYGSGLVTSDFEKYWWLNTDGVSLFYSDGRRNNVLCKDETVLINEPVSYVTLSNGRLFYVDETTGLLKSCSNKGDDIREITDAPVREYALLSDNTPVCSLRSGGIVHKGRVVSNANAYRLCLARQFLLFADMTQDAAICALDLSTERVTVLSGLTASYINAVDLHVYFTALTDDNRIYRYAMDTGSVVSFGGGKSAAYLHIIDDLLVFYTGSAWSTVPVSGGSVKEI